MTEDEARRVAREVAKEAVKEVLSSLGLDATDISDAQKDFIFLRSWRETTEVVRRKGMATTITILIAGVLGLIWMTITGNTPHVP